MGRDLTDYLLDIQAAMEEVEDFTSGMGFQEFSNDRKTVNATIRSLEVMGEAAKKIPEEVRQRYPRIPWREIAAMRDKLIHEYHGVDLEIVWETVKRDIPPLRESFQEVIQDMMKGRHDRDAE